MIRWCSYCQRYLGEKEPFSDFSVSHGICKSCTSTSASRELSSTSRSRKLARAYADLRESAQRGDITSVIAGVRAIKETFAVDPFDLCLGIIQPLLYEIGQLWSSGQVSVAKEHQFTRFAESLIAEVGATSLADKNVGPIDVLLVCANGNYHSIGIRTFELALRRAGYSATSIFPGLPAGEIVKLVEEFRPHFLGVSVSLSDHRKEVEMLAAHIGQIEPAARPHLLVGGSDLRTNHQNWTGLDKLGVTAISNNLDETLTLMAGLGKRDLSA